MSSAYKRLHVKASELKSWVKGQRVTMASAGGYRKQIVLSADLKGNYHYEVWVKHNKIQDKRSKDLNKLVALYNREIFFVVNLI